MKRSVATLQCRWIATQDDTNLSRTLRAEFPGRYVIFGHYSSTHLRACSTHSRSGFDREFAKAAVVAMGGAVGARRKLGKRKRDLLALRFGREYGRARCQAGLGPR
jgi:hypothetical protein